MPDDLNMMQAQLGLPNYGSVANPLGVPTIQAPPPPMVMHPGEVSVNLVQQAQQQTFQTLQSAQMTRPGGMGGYGTPGTGGGYGAFPTSNPMGSLGAFGQQFQSNMGAINQNQFGNPYYAQAISGMMGMPGFNQSMMPSPTMMTPPGMGIFRPFPQGPTPSIPPVPQLPLIPHPFTPQLPAPRFQTPMEYQYNVGNQRGQQYMSTFLGTPGVAAHGAADVGGSYLGAAAGAAVGGFLGGPRGVGIGSAVGALGGLAAAEFGGFGQTAEHIADRMNPFRSIGIRGAQMKGVSQGFVVGGTGLHESGRGLSTQSSQHLGRLIEDLAYDPQFRKEMGGPSQFSAQDMTRITRMSSDQGLLDMAQNPEQIRDQVKNVAKGVRSFMRLAGEPDVFEAIKQMGQLRAMGLSMPQIDATMQNVRMYAKMAGTTVKSLMEGAGLQGAMVFQQQGMSAGLGMQVGSAAMGHARQAVAGGAYSPAQLALLGGVQGVAQRDMETSAAMLKMPVMLAAASQMGRGGTFGLDAGAVRGLMGGKMDINQMATGGANNLLSAVNKGGVGALAMFQVQQNELSDQLGKVLGPEGINMMKMNQVMQTQKMLGVQGPGGFVTAAKAMGMDDQAARQMMLQANSPGYFRNVGQQYNRQIGELRVQGDEERKRTAPGVWHAMEQDETVGGIARGIGQAARGAYGSWRNMLESVNTGFAEYGEDAARRRQGRYSFRVPKELRADEQELRLAAGVSTEAKDRYAQRVRDERDQMSDTSALFTVGGHGYGRSSATKVFEDIMGGDANTMRQVRKAEGGYAGFFGGGSMERFGRLGLNVMTGGLGPASWGSAAYSDELRKRNADIGAGSNLMAKGLSASATDIDESRGQLSKAAGITESVASALQADVASKMAVAAKNEAPEWHHRLMGMEGGHATKSQIEDMIEQSGKKLNMTAEQIQKAKSNISAVATGAAGLGKALGGNKGRDYFSMPDTQDTKEHQDTVDAVRRVQLANGDKLFGKRRGEILWRSGGDDSRRDQTMKVLFGMYKDPRVSTLASLMKAAERSGDHSKVTAYIATLGKDEGTVRTQANDLLTTAGNQGVDDLVGDAGDTISTMKPEDATKEMATQGEEHLLGRTDMARATGIKKLFGAEGDLTKVLDKLAGDKEARSKLTGIGKKLANEWAGATADERKDLKARIEAVAPTTGENEGDVRGGNISIKEKLLQTAKEGLAAISGENANSFPEAVDTFKEASERMLEAAKTLGSANERTTLGEETQ